MAHNCRSFVSEFFRYSEVFHWNTIKGTPAYWKRFLYKVLAMVKQLGIPTFFMTLSCADLHWNELISIIVKLNVENLQEKSINNM